MDSIDSQCRAEAATRKLSRNKHQVSKSCHASLARSRRCTKLHTNIQELTDCLSQSRTCRCSYAKKNTSANAYCREVSLSLDMYVLVNASSANTFFAGRSRCPAFAPVCVGFIVFKRVTESGLGHLCATSYMFLQRMNCDLCLIKPRSGFVWTWHRLIFYSSYTWDEDCHVFLFFSSCPLFNAHMHKWKVHKQTHQLW